MDRENKKQLRKRVLSMRNSLDKDNKNSFDREIFNKLVLSELYNKSMNIFIYISFGSEVETKDIIMKALDDGKKVYVPKINGENNEMKAINIESLEGLVENSFGILEPISDVEISKEKIDLIIVPGAVFDKEGNRIGYGGGYYDRYLEAIKDKKNKIALVYDFQIVDYIPNEVHDIKVDYIISNKGFIKNYKNG